MSSGPLPTPRFAWNESPRPQYSELCLDDRFRGQYGPRSFLLAHTALEQMQAQPIAASHWLRGVVLNFNHTPQYDAAIFRNSIRSVMHESVLVDVTLAQGDRCVLSCVGAYESGWPTQAPRRAQLHWRAEPHQLPKLGAFGPEARDTYCRDASQFLAASAPQTACGGFARHREPRELGPHDLTTLLEPWFSMTSGPPRILKEIMLELHTPLPARDADPRRYTRILLQETQAEAHEQRLIAKLSTFAGLPLATVYLRLVDPPA